MGEGIQVSRRVGESLEIYCARGGEESGWDKSREEWGESFNFSVFNHDIHIIEM